MNEDKREIKFRCMDLQGDWHVGNISKIEKDISVGGIKIKAGYYISNKVGMPFAYHCRPETMTQFTGLKDKNGKEYWEGDIIQKGERIYEIVFNHGQWEAKIGDEYLCLHYYKDNFEIIGNIYENPDLIKLI